MTTFERFEHAIPELMTELAPAQVPDYFDDMLRQTAAHRQRPAWSFPERWLPMDIAVQPLTSRRFPWRPLLVLALVALVIAAALVAYVGSQQRLPPPFGLARNGLIVFSTVDRDISAVDPATGEIRPLITGPTEDIAPWFAPDGRHFMFVRTVEDGTAYWIADADGSNARQIVPPDVDWFEWSPSGDRIVVQRIVGTDVVTSVVDVATGESRTLDVGMEIHSPIWRPNHNQIVFTSEDLGSQRFYIVDADGTEPEMIKTALGTVNSPSLSPDGRSIAYATWETGVEGRQGRIHVLDLETGKDRGPAWAGSAGTEELTPIFSPDGTRLLIERYAIDGYRLVVAPVAGGGPEITLGEPHLEFSSGVSAAWSPDGKSILVTYNDDKRTWLYAADGSSEERVTWTTTGALTWQRLAP
jgi:Tol biopolymer transport system component